MKFSKAIAGIFAGCLSFGSAFATLTPTWETGNGAIKIVPYPHACNLTTQSATTDVYDYYLYHGGEAGAEVVVNDCSPSDGSVTWTSTEAPNYPEAYMSPGDLDGDSSGAYVLFREVGTKNFLHLQKHTSSGFQWDDNYDSDHSITGLGEYDSEPLFSRVDDSYVYTGVGYGSSVVLSVWDKSTGDQLATTTMTSGYTVTSAYLQRKNELSGLSASFVLLAEYNSSGVGMAKVTYDGTSISVTYSSQYAPSPPGITTDSLTAETTATGFGIDCSGSYAYLVGTSTYRLPDYDYTQRTWGFNLEFSVSGTTPSYVAWCGNFSGDNPIYGVSAPTICTQKCYGTLVGSDMWAENIFWYYSSIDTTPYQYSWFPDQGGNEYTQQTAFPYNVLQCAAYYNSSIPKSVAWFIGLNPAPSSSGAGIIRFTSTTSNPLTGSYDTFNDTTVGVVLDMEEGGSGEVYVAMSGATYWSYRFDM
ncbi:MAG TPA: hypothetical protein VGL56_12820 [Fimbriimonadaceae bacterium]|jgi:hypothetical protein